VIPSALLRESATIKSNQGESAYGRVDDHAVTVPCRVLPSKRLVRSADGSVVESVAQVELRPGVPIEPQDEVTIDGTVYRVLTVALQSQLTRPFSIVASLGRSET
jgi:hypothetical protein